MTERISLPAARRIALAAQGFADPRPSGTADRRHVRKVFDRVGLIQIDSVNVLVRSQELPLFARLGPHPRHLLPKYADDAHVFEYWGHEASLIPVEHHHLFRFKMDQPHWSERWASRIERERPGYLDAVLEEVAAKGPLTAGELADPGRKKGPWWGWNHGKDALELLFYRGKVTARRRANFEREYDLPSRLLPAAALTVPTPSADDARRELLALASRSLGVATAGDLADYYRIKLTTARPLVQDLVDAGRHLPVQVEGWKEPAFAHPDARTPRRVSARALLSPFDSLVWERSRNERLWDFHYRIEIYTPQPKRIYGYYVLPFLLGEHLVGRVDVKADRKAGVLRVPGAFAQPGVPVAAVAGELAEELLLMAGWLGLDSVAVGDKGDVAKPLSKALRGRTP
ncbi:MAG TPA: crosslink repair DNA glycosylase YcaQ family protein [Acidimicrobiales bacterium]